MSSFIPFTVEDAFHNQESGLVLYRIRVSTHETAGPSAGPVIRYLTGPRRPGGASIFPDHRGKELAFDTVPAKSWNLGHLVLPSSDNGNANGKFVLLSIETAPLNRVGLLDAGPTWCDAKLELIDLIDAFYAQREQQADTDEETTTDIQCMNHVSALVLPNPNPDPNHPTATQVVGVWAWQPGHAHGIAVESHVYSLIQARDPGLAPRFLGHLVDNGTRAVGFLLERVDGGAVREAGPADLQGCREALRRLHALGIAYGSSLRRHSFLVCGDGRVLMQGFGGSFGTEDEEVLRAEMEGLEEVLAGKSEMV